MERLPRLRCGMLVAMAPPRSSWTAQHVALARAHLTYRGVLEDSYATPMLRWPWKLAERLLRSWALSGRGTGPEFAYLAARTLFFDEGVTHALSEGATQVVVLGAGYDSRAWRLARSGVGFWEVDTPATQADKRMRAPSGGPRFVPAEIGRDRIRPCLEAEGFDPSAKTVFTVEGLWMYLPRVSVRERLEDLASCCAPGSFLVINFGIGGAGASPGEQHRPRAGAVAALSHEKFEFELAPDEASAFLAATGWKRSQGMTGPELGQHYLKEPWIHLGLNPMASCALATYPGRDAGDS